LINITLYGLIAFMLEVILARTLVRAMSDRKMIMKKMLLKEVIKLIVPLIPILGIVAGVVYLCIRYPPYSNNVFMMSLGLWLAALDSDLSALYLAYLAKDNLLGSITELRHKVIRYVKLITIAAYIYTAIYIVIGSLVLVTYLIYLRAVASGLTKIPAFLTYQQAILILLLLVVLLPLTYVVRRETRKAIRLGMENAMIA